MYMREDISPLKAVPSHSAFRKQKLDHSRAYLCAGALCKRVGMIQGCIKNEHHQPVPLADPFGKDLASLLLKTGRIRNSRPKKER